MEAAFFIGHMDALLCVPVNTVTWQPVVIIRTPQS